MKKVLSAGSIAALVWAGFISGTPLAFAAVSVTAATGGSAISADTAGGAYTSLTGPVIAESVAGEIGDGGSSATIILNAPAGFRFSTTTNGVNVSVTDVGTCVGNGNKKLKISASGNGNGSGSADVTPTTSTISVSINQSSANNCHGTLTFSGIAVRPTAGTPLASGNITKSGTSVVSGITDGVTNLGTLTEVAGAASKAAFTTQPGGAAYGSLLSPQPVIKTQDQFGNNSTSGLAASNMVALTLTSGAGSLQGTTSLDIGTGAGNGTVSFTNLKVSAAGAGKVLTATPSGLTAATSSPFAIAQLPITVTAVTNSKVYDASTTAAGVPVITSGSLAPGDTAAFTEAYDTAAVGTGKTLAPAGSVSDGNGGANYSVTLVNDTTGEITAAPLTVSAAGIGKVYDGNTTAEVTLSSDKIGGDDVATSYTSASFATSTIGEWLVSVSGISISGADAGNYLLSNTEASTTANITAASATVALSDLNRVYDGTPKSATVTTDPSGLSVNVTYDGSPASPTSAGSYAVVAAVNDPNYAGSASGTLVIGKADQTITFGALSGKSFGDPDFPVSATAGSGLEISFAASGICTVSATGTVHLTGIGDCTITASQAGDGNWNAASDVAQSFTVADTTPPVITLIGSSTVNLTVGDSYADAGATALDDVDGDITANILSTSTVNTSVVGTYSVIYNVSDAALNPAVQVTRTVNVSAVPVPSEPAPASTPSVTVGGNSSAGSGGGTGFGTPTVVSGPAPEAGTAASQTTNAPAGSSQSEAPAPSGRVAGESIVVEENAPRSASAGQIASAGENKEEEPASVAESAPSVPGETPETASIFDVFGSGPVKYGLLLLVLFALGHSIYLWRRKPIA